MSEKNFEATIIENPEKRRVESYKHFCEVFKEISSIGKYGFDHWFGALYKGKISHPFSKKIGFMDNCDNYWWGRAPSRKVDLLYPKIIRVHVSDGGLKYEQRIVSFIQKFCEKLNIPGQVISPTNIYNIKKVKKYE